jgi:hypothetical protein
VSTSAAPIRHAPLDLWRIAAAFLNTLFNLFGAPEDVAARHTLTGPAHALMRDWLRAGEALLRKLILIEAAGYAPGPPASSRQNPRKQRGRQRMEFAPDHPEDWRVSIRCFVSPALRQAQGDGGGRAGGSGSVSLSVSKTARPNAPRFHSAWPLAERYEALIRVVNDPAPYARRLARRLYRAPQTARLVLKHHSSAAALVGVIEFDTLCCAADEARNHAFPDTS